MWNQRALHTFLVYCIGLTAATAPTKDQIGELDAGLDFFEFDLEDRCIAQNNILWEFYDGRNRNLSELIGEELATSNLLKKEVKSDEAFRDAEIDVSKTKRKLDLLFSSGAALMNQSIFEEFTKFAVNGQAGIVDPKTAATYQGVQNILRTERNATKLAEPWSNWTQAVQNVSGDLTQQISLLPLEAEANSADRVEKYWLSISEVTTTDYEGLTKLWKTLIPLYQKLRQVIASGIVKKFGSQVFLDPMFIPVHLLGSLDSSDWVTAAHSLEIFEASETYAAIQKKFADKSSKDLYSDADDLTAQLDLKYLHEDFWKNSKFEDESSTCVHFMEKTCKSDVTPKVLNCKERQPSVASFLRAHREVASIKHHALASEVDNGQGFLLREGPRDSVLYEAIATASSLLALHPDNLLRRGLIESKYQDANMTSLLITALNIIPPLPLHLSFDLWRLEVLNTINKDSQASTEEPMTTVAFDGDHNLQKRSVDNYLEENEHEEQEDESLEKDSQEDTETSTVSASTTEAAKSATNSTSSPLSIKPAAMVENIAGELPSVMYNRANLSAHWWAIRGKYQGVGSPDLQTNYEDFLQDQLVLWNRPHISKFLGPILLFQIMENFKAKNTSENRELLRRLLQKGKSEPWEIIVEDLFNITKLDAQPMINYFNPLISFLDNGAKFKENSASPGFADNDYNLFLHSTGITADSETRKTGVQSAGNENSSAVMIVLIGLAIVGSAAAVISVVRRRLLKRRQAKDRREFSEG